MMKDIYLKPRPDGQDILLFNGLPNQTGGLDNMIYMLLITSDWWGNTESVENGTLDSSIPQIMASKPLTNQTRLDIISEAERVTAQMVTAGITDRIEITGSIPKVGTLYLSVKTFEPERPEGPEFIYSLNWERQKIGFPETDIERIKEPRTDIYISETGDIYVSETGDIYVSDTYLI